MRGEGGGKEKKFVGLPVFFFFSLTHQISHAPPPALRVRRPAHPTPAKPTAATVYAPAVPIRAHPVKALAPPSQEAVVRTTAFEPPGE